MDGVDARIEIAALRERIGSLDDKLGASHRRMDRVEADIRSDLKAIYDKVDALSAYMHRSSGAIAAWVIVGGVVGSTLVGAIVWVLKQGGT